MALLVAVALIGAAGWIIYQRGNSSWQSASQSIGGKLLPNFQVNDVSQIKIQSGTNELLLARRDDLWRVGQRDNYPADFSKISGLLEKLGDLKVVQSDQIGPSERDRFNLSPAGSGDHAGTLVDLEDQSGKSVASLLLGKQHMNQQGGGDGWPDGRYIIANNDTNDVVAISDPLDDIQTGPGDWLDKTFFKVANPKSISVTFPIATNSWKLSRASATNDWQLADARPGEKLDASKIDGVTSPFDAPSFDDVLPGSDDPSNATTVAIQTFDGVSYTAKVWAAPDDSDYMTIAIAATSPTNQALADAKQFANWTYKVPGYTVESLLKPRSAFLVAAKPAASAQK